jgi:diguanylate cyclase
MMSILSSIPVFLDPVGLTIVLVYVYGYFHRTVPTTITVNVAMGVVFGAATWIAMASPMVLANGDIMDLRNLFVGVAAAFFGWRAAIITVCMAISARLGIGGSGAMAGALGVVIAATMGLAWARYVRPKRYSNMISLPILAVMISLHISSVFVMPSGFVVSFLTNVAPMLIALNFLGVGVFAILLHRERSLLSSKNYLMLAAATDPLTKLFNRRSLADQYDRIANHERMRRGFAMVCIDVDNFTAINDRYGQLAGDHVLVDISHRIASCLRPTDLFARLNSDEFLIVLTNVASDDARMITDRCRKLISRAPVATEGSAIRVTISIGTVWSPKAEDFVKFCDAADAALSRAKSLGRDCVAFNSKHDFTDPPSITAA